MNSNHLTNAIVYLERRGKRGTRHWLALCKERDLRFLRKAANVWIDIRGNRIQLDPTTGTWVEAVPQGKSPPSASETRLKDEKDKLSELQRHRKELEDRVAEGVPVFKDILHRMRKRGVEAR